MLLFGGALDQAGNWDEAKPVLERAVAAAPEEPEALNHLGYAMLEHGDNLTEATRLIAKASALRPDSAAITDSLGWAFYLRGQPKRPLANIWATPIGQRDGVSMRAMPGARR